MNSSLGFVRQGLVPLPRRTDQVFEHRAPLSSESVLLQAKYVQFLEQFLIWLSLLCFLHPGCAEGASTRSVLESVCPELSLALLRPPAVRCLHLSVHSSFLDRLEEQMLSRHPLIFLSFLLHTYLGKVGREGAHQD